LKVLIVEDEPSLAQMVERQLLAAGMQTVVARDGESAVPAVRATHPDAVLLDVNLPGRSGLDVARDIRADPTLSRTPIIFLTGRTEEVDRVVGFELGADDYITKPFSPRELLLRIKAILRRAGETMPASARFGALTIDEAQRRVLLDNEPVILTAKEFDLLLRLSTARGRVVSRAQLLRDVWGYEHPHVLTRTIDVHMRHLRQKLGPEAWRLETVKGVGYRFEPKPARTL
jgi:two-component system phosphate regulon response regulator PhoB